MRKQNVIIFSSGESERSGLLAAIKKGLTNAECYCFDWRNLFADANSEERVALLPMLIKKIPSFDYAVLICEGHDKLILRRGGNRIKEHSMRDNVLFEIGMCTMALGASRVILLTDRKVRIPDDLIGINDIGLKQIVLVDGEIGISGAVGQIAAYIEQSKPDISPVVVGAAVSTAEGYMTNFILRTLESIDSGVTDSESGEKLEFERLSFNVILPELYGDDTPAKAKRRVEQLGLRRGWVEARSRRAEFGYILKDGKLCIYDLPTSLAASYNTAREILNIDADDRRDERASERFTAKELDLFELTLRKLSKKEAALARLAHFGYDSEKANSIAQRLEDCLTVTREEY